MTAASRKQIGMIHGLLGKFDVIERDDKLRAIAAVTYRPIQSTNDLTASEASVVINTLQGIQHNADNPARALAGLVKQHAERQDEVTV